MATTTVPKGCDIETAGIETPGWREALGLTVHPDPNHVHGVTALTQQEWRRLAHAHPERRYVVVYEQRRVPRFGSVPKARAAAWADMRAAVWSAWGRFAPPPGYRISVMAAEDWQAVSR